MPIFDILHQAYFLPSTDLNSRCRRSRRQLHEAAAHHCGYACFIREVRNMDQDTGPKPNRTGVVTIERLAHRIRVTLLHALLGRLGVVLGSSLATFFLPTSSGVPQPPSSGNRQRSTRRTVPREDLGVPVDVVLQSFPSLPPLLRHQTSSIPSRRRPPCYLSASVSALPLP